MVDSPSKTLFCPRPKLPACLLAITTDLEQKVYFYFLSDSEGEKSMSYYNSIKMSCLAYDVGLVLKKPKLFLVLRSNFIIHLPSSAFDT